MIGTWTPKRTEQLKQLAAEGTLSASQMGAELGVSRNAVIGKIHREKFDWPHARTFPNKPRTPRPRSTHPKLPKARRSPASPERKATLQDVFRQASEATDIAAEMITGGVTIVDLESHHCRWPLSGHPKEVPPEKFLYCGKDRLEPLPYCGGHCRMAYRSEREVREIELWRAKCERRWVAA